MMFRYLAGVLFLTFTFSSMARVLDELCTRQDLFALSTQDFGKEYGRKLQFRWTSKERNGARAFGQMSFKGIPAVEALVEFEGDRVSGVSVSVYNRGDKGAIPEEDFLALVKKSETCFAEICKSKGAARRRSGATKMASTTWQCEKLVYRLEHDATTKRVDGKKVFNPEFIRFRVFPYEKGKQLTSYGVSRRSGNIKSIKDKVVTAENGDVYIDKIPMVDQGQKGYCACATTARVLQHYGRDIDQHEVAKIALTGERGGTSPTELMKALKRMQSKMGFKLRVYQEFDFRDFQKMVKDYNKKAKRMDKKRVHLQTGGTINIGQIYQSFDVDALKAAKCKGTKFKGFERNIQNCVKKGMPLLWSCQLGMIKEKGIPQASGGHMRLIIGYNSKTREIIYSDSWGAGHEFKRMPMDDAYTITTNLFSIRSF